MINRPHTLTRRAEPCGIDVRACCMHAHEASRTMQLLLVHIMHVVGFELDDAGCCAVVLASGVEANISFAHAGSNFLRDGSGAALI